MNRSKPRLAIFDFDGTLLRRDSFPLFLRYASGSYWNFLRTLLHAAPILLRYYMGAISAQTAKERILGIVIGGKSTNYVKALCQNFALNVLSQHERPAAMAALARHQAGGDRVCIVSASPRDWITPWAANLGITEVYGVNLSVEYDDIVTGGFDGPNCKGAAKIAYLQNAIPDFSTQFETFAYGDSPSDKSLLGVVEHAYYRTFPV